MVDEIEMREETGEMGKSGISYSVEGIGHIAKKIAQVMAELEILGRDGENKHHHYKYTSIHEVAAALAPLLAKNNMAIIPSIQAATRDGSLALIDCQFTLVDGDSGAWMSVPWVAEGADAQDKRIIKAMRAALKYFLISTFLASSGDEEELDEGPAPGATKRAPQAPPAPGGKSEKKTSSKSPSGARPQGKPSPKPLKIREIIRGRAGWDGDKRYSGEKAEPISKDTQHNVQAIIAMSLAFAGATQADIRDNAKVLLEWLLAVQDTGSLTEREGQAICYAWMGEDGKVNEYGKREAQACLNSALDDDVENMAKFFGNLGDESEKGGDPDGE